MWPFVLGYWRYFAAAALLMVAFACGWRLGAAAWKAEKAEAEARHAKDIATWQRKSAEAAAAVMVRERGLQLAVDTAREDLDHAKAQLREADARVARLVVDTNGLRQQLGSFAAGTGSADSASACQRRAGELAELLAESAGLLAEGVGLVRETALAHDERAAEVAALLKAWPRGKEDH
jgi:hypothetical protein